jgi:hypothetical protein
MLQHLFPFLFPARRFSFIKPRQNEKNHRTSTIPPLCKTLFIFSSSRLIFFEKKGNCSSNPPFSVQLFFTFFIRTCFLFLRTSAIITFFRAPSCLFSHFLSSLDLNYPLFNSPLLYFFIIYYTKLQFVNKEGGKLHLKYPNKEAGGLTTDLRMDICSECASALFYPFIEHRSL